MEQTAFPSRRGSPSCPDSAHSVHVPILRKGHLLLQMDRDGEQMYLLSICYAIIYARYI